MENKETIWRGNPDAYNDSAYGHVAVLYHPHYRSPTVPKKGCKQFPGSPNIELESQGHDR